MRMGHAMRRLTRDFPLAAFLRTFVKIILIFTALSFAVASSAGTVTVDRYLKDKIAFSNYHVSWLDGVFNGLRAANFELRRTGKSPLFCSPQNLSLTALQVKSLFDQFIVTHKDVVKPSDSIGVLLLEAAREAYPCPTR
jgi:hypothetical protein